MIKNMIIEVLSLVRLNIQHKNIIHSILVYYKKCTEASARLWLLTVQFGWLLSFQNKGSKITDLRQRNMKGLSEISEFYLFFRVYQVSYLLHENIVFIIRDFVYLLTAFHK